MIKQIIILVFIINCYICTAQKNASLYDKAITNYDKENYDEAFANFQLAKNQFQTNKEIVNVVECLTYISSIKSIQGDFKSSLASSNKALLYFKTHKIDNDSLYSELVSIKTLGLKFLGDFKKAYDVSDSLIDYLKSKKENQKFLTNAYQIRSRVEIDLGNYDDAINSAKKALKLNKETNDERKAALLNIIGVGFYFNEELDSTSYYYNASYEIKQRIQTDNYQLAIATYNLGTVEESLGDYDKAIVFYNKAVQHDLLDGGEAVGFLSDIYVALTNTYFKKNDLEKAEEFAEKALQIAIKKYGDDSPQTSFVYIAYSNIFELKGDYEKSIEYIEKALEIRRKTYGNKHRWTAESLLSISESLIEVKRYEEAEHNYKEAISIAKSIGNNLVLAYAEMGLGTIYMKTSQQDLASQFLETSKSKFIKAYGNYHETHLSVLAIEAENHFTNNKSEKSLDIIEDIKANATNSNLYYRLDALTLQLDVALHNFIQKKDTKLLNTIINDLDATIELIVKIRQDYPSNKSKIYVNNSMSLFISKAIKAAYILYENSNSSKYLESAFKLSEINRNSNLVEGIQDVRFKKMANVPERLLKQENSLNQNLASLKKEMYYEENEEQPDEDYISQLLSEQLACRKSLDSLLSDIKSQYPKYYQLKYRNKSSSIIELQDNYIDKDETLIEYFIEKSDVYVFVISKSRADLIKLSNSDKIVDIIQDFRIRLKQRKDVTEQSKELHNLLLKDLDIQTKRLIIIPDKQLNHLPFEALIDNSKYLIEDYVISYSGSASLLETQKNAVLNLKFTSNWSGFAPSYLENKTLVANQTEIELIAELMKGESFLGSDASLQNFEKVTQNSSILHLATHAQVANDNPLYNHLVFSNDSILTASDIYTLSINADLAVLSACETGFGKLEKSEGVMSMSRAFQYAGVQSTVMSLWKIPDQESSKLMVSFYKHLKKGLHKDDALRNAKLDYLNLITDKTLRHPYFWAGFVISGDASPLQNATPFYYYIVLVLVLLGLLMFVRKFYNKKT